MEYSPGTAKFPLDFLIFQILLEPFKDTDLSLPQQLSILPEGLHMRSMYPCMPHQATKTKLPTLALRYWRHSKISALLKKPLHSF